MRSLTYLIRCSSTRIIPHWFLYDLTRWVNDNVGTTWLVRTEQQRHIQRSLSLQIPDHMKVECARLTRSMKIRKDFFADKSDTGSGPIAEIWGECWHFSYSLKSLGHNDLVSGGQGDFFNISCGLWGLHRRWILSIVRMVSWRTLDCMHDAKVTVLNQYQIRISAAFRWIHLCHDPPVPKDRT